MSFNMKLLVSSRCGWSATPISDALQQN